MKEKLIRTTDAVPARAITRNQPVPLILKVTGETNLQNEGGNRAVLRKDTRSPAAAMMLTWMRIWLSVKASAANAMSDVPRLKRSDLTSGFEFPLLDPA